MSKHWTEIVQEGVREAREKDHLEASQIAIPGRSTAEIVRTKEFEIPMAVESHDSGWDVATRLHGKVNDAAIGCIPAGCLLVSGASMDLVPSPPKMTLNVVYRDRPWNHFYDAWRGDFAGPCDANGALAFPAADFSAIG